MIEKLKIQINLLKKDVAETPKKYTTLVGAMCLMVSLGIVHSLAALSPYYMSYLREYKGDDNVRYSQTIYISSVQNIFIALASVFSGFLKNQFMVNLKVITGTGAFLLRFV